MNFSTLDFSEDKLDIALSISLLEVTMMVVSLYNILKSKGIISEEEFMTASEEAKQDPSYIKAIESSMEQLKKIKEYEKDPLKAFCDSVTEIYKHGDQSKWWCNQ